MLSHVQLCDPMDCSPLDSSVLGIFQPQILEQVAISSSRESSQPRDRTFPGGRRILYPWVTWESCWERKIFKVFTAKSYCNFVEWWILINWHDDGEIDYRVFKTKRQDTTPDKMQPNLTHRSNGQQLRPTGVQWLTLRTSGSELSASLAGWPARATLPKKHLFLQQCVSFLLYRLKREHWS